MSGGSDFQRRAGEQGRWFEETCIKALEWSGFHIADRRTRFDDLGVDVDIIATNAKDISFYINCKGSLYGPRPGLKRTDTLKKAIADAWLLKLGGRGPCLLLTSHIPEDGVGKTMLNLALTEGLYIAVIRPVEDQPRLRFLGSASEADLRTFEGQSPGSRQGRLY